MTTTLKTNEIPVIDISGALARDAESLAAVIDEIDQACRNVGFFVIVGHGIDPDLIRAVRSASFELFDLDTETKSKYESAYGGRGGYMRSEAVSYSHGEASPPDLKESFTVYNRTEENCPVDLTPDAALHYKACPWPEEVPAFRDALWTYYAEMDALGAKVMSLFALALNLPEDHFAPFINHSISSVRVLHYPPLESEPLPGQLRAGAHTDFGSLTLLLTDEAPGGLQVESHIHGWTNVPYVANSFVVNIGDLMARWTNNRWVSTLHRVVTPEVGPNTRRLSAAFFHQPNHDALIETLPSCLAEGETDQYEPVKSGDYMIDRIMKQRNMGAK